MKTHERTTRIHGLLIGTAVGDALGLPAEGLCRRRILRLYQGHWRHRLVFGRGMISDDTEHTIFVAQCLLRHIPLRNLLFLLIVLAHGFRRLLPPW
jgi:ADP-ribosylglycohydrolase